MGDPHLSVNLFVASPLWKRNFSPAWAIPYALPRILMWIKNSAAACRLPCLPWRIAWVRVVNNLSPTWRRESSIRMTIWQSSAWVLLVMKPCPRRLGALFSAFFRTGWHEGGIWARGNYALWRNNTGSKGQIWLRFAGIARSYVTSVWLFRMRCRMRPAKCSECRIRLFSKSQPAWPPSTILANRQCGTREKSLATPLPALSFQGRPQFNEPWAMASTDASQSPRGYYGFHYTFFLQMAQKTCHLIIIHSHPS